MILPNHRRSVLAFFVTGGLVAALAAWMILATAASAATTYYVDPTGNNSNPCTAPGAAACLTIQGAIGKAAAGDTVQVAAGTYAENVTVPVALTGLSLKGAQAGVAVGGRTAAGPAESTVNGSGGQTAIRVDAAGVTIDGFSVTDVQTAFAVFGIDVRVTADDIVIKNNIIDTVTTADTGANGTAQGIYLDVGPDNAQILNNRISNVHSNRSAKGVLIGDSSAANSSAGALIQGNSISGITSDTRGAYGVQANNAAGVPSMSVLNNTFSTLNGGGWLHAVGIETDAPDVLVYGNSFSSLTSGSADNTAVWFEAPDTSFPSGNVNQNNFNYTNAFGIAVDPAAGAGSVDGTCNWWGDASGPGLVASGSGANVTAKVTYSPFLAGQAPGVGVCAPPTPIPTPDPNAVGGLVDVVTGGSGSGSAGLAWLLVGLFTIAAFGSGGAWVLLRRRS